MQDRPTKPDELAARLKADHDIQPDRRTIEAVLNLMAVSPSPKT
jgi:hypothetical protein